MHLSICRGYQYKHIHFEWHSYCGPTFLRIKDSEPKSQQLRPMRDYAALAKWESLNKEEREEFGVY